MLAIDRNPGLEPERSPEGTDLPAEPTRHRHEEARVPAWYYAGASLVVGLTSAVAALLRAWFAVPDLEVLYFLAVLIAAVRFGRGPSVLAAALAVALYDFFFAPPVLTFHVADARYLLTFAMMFAGGLLVSELAARIRRQEREALLREERTATLYALSRELAATPDASEAAHVVVRHAALVFGAAAHVLRSFRGVGLAIVASDPADARPQPANLALAASAQERRRTTGLAADEPTGPRALCAPFCVRDQTLGVLLLEPRSVQATLHAPQPEFLEAFAGQAAFAFERARLSEEAQAAALRAETEQMRGSLLSAVSHDLRTPLASITGAASSLRDDPALRAEVKTELLETICEEADRLERLVANLLDMTRIESGAVVLKKEWLPLEEAIGSAFTRLENKLGARAIHISLPADLPLLLVDPLLLEQVFVNLIENAAKYTPQGSPIEVNATVGGEDVVIDVLDRGPGLTSGTEEHLFEKFYRGTHVGARGIGLGLAICRWIVEAHGGQIRAQNREGGGTRFRMTIPLTKPTPLLEPESSANKP